MQVEVGKIYDGKVVGITKFGAFVALDSETKGMVHISEVSHTFVNDIKDHLSDGQEVKVKVLSVGDGKISLSIKKATEPPAGGNGNKRRKEPARQPYRPREVYNGSDAPVDWEPKKTTSNQSFEDMLSSFKQKSEEKIGDLKRITEGKRKGASRKR